MADSTQSWLDDKVAQALDIGAHPARADRTIDITTTGARSGLPRRIEIWFWQVDGRWYLASDPGPRSWYANLLANPRFTVHLKNDVRADLPALAEPIADRQEREDVLSAVLEQSGRDQDALEQWVAESPLVEIRFLAPDRDGRQSANTGSAGDSSSLST